MLPNYDYNKVLISLKNVDSNVKAKLLAHSLSYAQSNGHFKLQEKAEEITKHPEAQRVLGDYEPY